MFSSGNKRDKEGDRETYCCCKARYAWALAIRPKAKAALISPGKPRLFLPPSRKPRLFPPSPRVREIALRRKPRLFLPAPGARNRPRAKAALISPGSFGSIARSRAYFSRLLGSHTSRSRAYFSRLVESHNSGPSGFSRDSAWPSCFLSAICSLPRMISSTNSLEG